MPARKPAAKAPAKKPAVKKAPAKKAPVKAAAKKPARKRTPKDKSVQIEAMCQEYVLNGGDQAKAYRAAFPNSLKWKAEAVHVEASKEFRNPNVRLRVSELQAEARKIAEERFSIDSEYVLRRLAEIDQMDAADLFDDQGNLLHIQKWPKVWRQYISGMDVSEIWAGTGDEREVAGVLKKIKWPDKVKNLELLGRHITVQAWKESVKHEVDSIQTVNITADLPPEEASKLYRELINSTMARK